MRKTFTHLYCFLLFFFLLNSIPCSSNGTNAIFQIVANGKVNYLVDNERYFEVLLGAHNMDWIHRDQNQATILEKIQKTDKLCLVGEMPILGQPEIVFEQFVWWRPDTFGQHYFLELDEELEFKSLHISINLYVSAFAEAMLKIKNGASETNLVLPSATQVGPVTIWTGLADSILITKPGLEPLQFSFENKRARVLINDNRNFSLNKFEIRIVLAGDAAPGSGPVLSQGIMISGLDNYQTVFDDRYQIDTTGWFPFQLAWNQIPAKGSAIDRSFLLDPPAGKHGFLTVEGEKFVFEDGTEAKFWGVNFSGAANFPTHEQAEQIAKRLAGYGFNIVRLHHLDAGWTTSLFDKSYNDTQHYNAEMFDRLDYFIYCLKREGIYVYLDQLVNRYFKPGDNLGIDLPAIPLLKGFTYFVPRLIELQKKYSYDLWTHYNPYTKLRYCDDPVIVLTEIKNENDLFRTYEDLLTIEPYAAILRDKWHEWRENRGLGRTDLPAELKDGPLIEFLSDLQADFYQQMMSYLRQIGVKVPIAGTNWSRWKQDQQSQMVCDFMGQHSYWDHPTNNVIKNLKMLKQSKTSFDNMCFSAQYQKPLVVSEWCHPRPNSSRAEATAWTAAIASLQNWNGLILYTYSHSNDESASYLDGSFNMFNDPSYMGLMPTASLLYLRGDVSKANNKYVVQFPEGEALFNLPLLDINEITAYRGGLVEHSLVRNAFGNVVIGDDNIQVIGYQDRVYSDSNVIRHSDTGQIERNVQDGVLLIKTPGTEVAQGFIGGKEIALTKLKVRTENKFAVISLSSVDSQEIGTAERLLLTVVSGVENSNAVYDLLRTKIIQNGTAPVLVQPVVAELELLLDGSFSVWALNERGVRTQQLPVADKKFRVDGSYETIWFEIVRE